jgi:UDP-N-acetylmuramoyl-tripeptide--D-alanyl-D-alanine ligase
VAKVLDVDLKLLEAGINVTMPQGRSQSWKLPGDIIVLDETYNAAPEAMLAALELLAQTPGSRKIAVLGAMKELGERSTKLHQQVGEKVRKLNLDGLLVLVDGPDAEIIATSAQGIPCERCHNHSDLVSLLKTYVQPGDRLLFKAAHSVGLEKVVQQFCGEINS